MNREQNNIYDKTTELIYRISDHPDFQLFIKDFRKRYQIPINGFGDKESIDKWRGKKDRLIDFLTKQIVKGKRGHISHTMLRPDDIDPVGFELVKQRILGLFKLPATPQASDILEQYLLTNELPVSSESGGDSLFMIETVQIPKTQRPYVKLVIFDGASQPDCVAFIQKHWKEIKKAIQLEGGSKPDSKFRRTKATNRARYNLTMQLSKLKREQLDIKKGATPTKSGRIAEILREHGYKDSSMRSVNRTQEKRRRAEKTPLIGPP